MGRLAPLGSMALATILALFAAAPAAAQYRTTSIEVYDIDINPSQGGLQEIRIAGDQTQPLTLTFSPSLPHSFHSMARDGQPCQAQDGAFVCPGRSPDNLGQVLIQYYAAPEATEVTYSVTATTPDGGYGVGSVNVRIPADIEVHPNFTRWYMVSETSPTAILVVAVRNNGPQKAYEPAVIVTGVNTSLGVPAGCQIAGQDVICSLADIPYPHPLNRPGTVEITIPECAVADPVTIVVSAPQTDPNPDNNIFTLPGIPGHPDCATPRGGGSGGGSGGGAGGGSAGAGGGGQAAGPSASPSSNDSASPSPTTREPSVAGTSPAAAAAGTDHGSNSGWFAVGIGAVVVPVLGGLGGWWFWRRRVQAG